MWLYSGWPHGYQGPNFHSFKHKASFTWAQLETPDNCPHNFSSAILTYCGWVALLIVSINKSIASHLYTHCHGNPGVILISRPLKATPYAEMIQHAGGKISRGKRSRSPSPPVMVCHAAACLPSAMNPPIIPKHLIVSMKQTKKYSFAYKCFPHVWCKGAFTLAVTPCDIGVGSQTLVLLVFVPGPLVILEDLWAFILFPLMSGEW